MPTFVSHCACNRDFEALLEYGSENGPVNWTVNPNAQIGDIVATGYYIPNRHHYSH